MFPVLLCMCVLMLFKLSPAFLLHVSVVKHKLAGLGKLTRPGVGRKKLKTFEVKTEKVSGMVKIENQK